MRSNNLLHSIESYASAIKKLFPQGVYWDAQFESPESDISKWVRLKAEELYRFRRRFSDLITESTPKTADTTLDDWERVLLGSVNPSIQPELRRSLLMARRRGHIDRTRSCRPVRRKNQTRLLSVQVGIFRAHAGRRQSYVFSCKFFDRLY